MAPCCIYTVDDAATSSDESELAAAAWAALEHGRPDAAVLLAELVDKLAAPVRNYITEGASLTHEATS